MNTQYEIHDRIFRFVINGLKIIKHIPSSVESRIIIDQYARALTSVGANDNEADGVSSKKDFIHCYTVVRKELKETRYWLRILAELYPRLKSQIDPLLKENEELIKIISTIIRNSSQ